MPCKASWPEPLSCGSLTLGSLPTVVCSLFPPPAHTLTVPGIIACWAYGNQRLDKATEFSLMGTLRGAWGWEGREANRERRGYPCLVIILRDLRACMQSQPGMAVCLSGHFLSLGTCKLSGTGSLYVSWLPAAAFYTSSTALLLGLLASCTVSRSSFL